MKKTPQANTGITIPHKTGIAEIIPSQRVLTVPPDRPPTGSLRYSLGFPFQAGPHTCGLLLMRMTEETPNYGFLDGSDVILLDALKQADPPRIFAATRNAYELGSTPDSNHLFMRSPLIGGFVPLGALRADGTPHPHAGTGFGLAQAHRVPFRDNLFSWVSPERSDFNEIYQLAYDGTTFTARLSDCRAQTATDPLQIGDTGWWIMVSGLSSAIPDGDDLLSAATVARDNGTPVSVGVIRWTCRQGTWKPTAYDPVAISSGPAPTGPTPTEQCPWMEPSLARANDNSLFFTARDRDSFQQEGDQGQGYQLRLWRSTPAGLWHDMWKVPNARLNAPLSINVTTDGTPYMVSTPYDPTGIPETNETGRRRERLVLWPLSADGTKIEPFRLVRNCLADFGPPPSRTTLETAPEKWMADHPNGMNVRLKDGSWHHVLAYRVCHSPRYRASGAKPSPHSGCHVAEIISQGPAKPMWRFAEDR